MIIEEHYKSSIRGGVSQMTGIFSWTIFTYMLLIGFIFAIVTFIASSLGGSSEGGGDAGDISGDGDFDGDTDISDSGGFANLFSILLPLSPLVWCIFLLIAGAVGEIMIQSTGANFIICLIVSVLIGYLAMLSFNKFVLLPMKRAKNYANSEEDLLGAEAIVFERIAEGEGRKGAVRVKGPSGFVIYTALSENHKEIKIGTAVRVVLIQNNTATVISENALFDESNLLAKKYDMEEN